MAIIHALKNGRYKTVNFVEFYDIFMGDELEEDYSTEGVRAIYEYINARNEKCEEYEDRYRFSIPKIYSNFKEYRNVYDIYKEHPDNHYFLTEEEFSNSIKSKNGKLSHINYIGREHEVKITTHAVYEVIRIKSIFRNLKENGYSNIILPNKHIILTDVWQGTTK